MRILMISDFYAPHVGGVEVVVRNLAHELGRRGHDIAIATIRTDGLPEHDVDGAVRVHRISTSAQRVSALARQPRPWAAPVPDPEATRALRRLLAVERPEIVHGHDWLARSFLPLKRSGGPALVMSLHYFTQTCAKKSLLFRGAPCSGPGLAKCLGCAGAHYGPIRGTGVVLGNFALAALERRLVDLYLPVSHAAARGNGLVGRPAEYEVVPNFVLDAATVSAGKLDLLDELPADGFLLFVGDLRTEKGIHVLLEAYARLEDAPPLVLIGKVWPDSPRLLPANVRLLTDWPNEAVREAQRRCAALVAPSIWPEPFGMVVLETLAEGRPVIVSRIGGLTEVVEEGVGAELVPPRDVEALRDALARMVADHGLRHRLAEHSRRSAARFRPEAIVPRVERAYARAIERRGRATGPRRMRSPRLPVEP
jgi:glycosyltransferase involved in cell wall biosynthesis